MTDEQFKQAFEIKQKIASGNSALCNLAAGDVVYIPAELRERIRFVIKEHVEALREELKRL